MSKNEGALAAVALEVARHLEGPWAPAPALARCLAGAGGIHLLFREAAGRPRGEVCGLLPEGVDRLFLSSEEWARTAIRVDLGRSPAAIAREVEWRLLPVYSPFFADCVTWIAAERAFEAARFNRYSWLAPEVSRLDP